MTRHQTWKPGFPVQLLRSILETASWTASSNASRAGRACEPWMTRALGSWGFDSNSNVCVGGGSNVLPNVQACEGVVLWEGLTKSYQQMQHANLQVHKHY